MAVSLHRYVPLFSLPNLNKIGFQIKVFELAWQEDSKTPPESLIWSKIELVIEAIKLCSLIFSKTRSRQGFCGSQFLHQILVKFAFQGVFWNCLDEQILKLTLGFQWNQDLAEKTCWCKLTATYCIWFNPKYFCLLFVKLQLYKDPLGQKASCNSML